MLKKIFQPLMIANPYTQIMRIANPHEQEISQSEKTKLA